MISVVSHPVMELNPMLKPGIMPYDSKIKVDFKLNSQKKYFDAIFGGFSL